MLELYVKIKNCSTEALFTSEWLKKLKLKGFWAHKISDWWIWLKPFDWIIQTNISNYFFEAKRIEKDIKKQEDLIKGIVRGEKIKNNAGSKQNFLVICLLLWQN